jgi:ubiquitin carboxyl-terminal hydrolase L5
LNAMVTSATEDIESLKTKLAEPLKKKEGWRNENIRRRHDYVPFILTAMKHLAKKKKLVTAYEIAKRAADAATSENSGGAASAPAIGAAS